MRVSSESGSAADDREFVLRRRAGRKNVNLKIAPVPIHGLHAAETRLEIEKAFAARRLDLELVRRKAAALAVIAAASSPAPAISTKIAFGTEPDKDPEN